jgi:hypothetical protein
MEDGRYSRPYLGVPYPTGIEEDAFRRLVIVGLFDTVNGLRRQDIVRLYPDGRVDPDFRPGNGLEYITPQRRGLAYRVRVTVANEPVVVGGFQQVDGEQRSNVVRYRAGHDPRQAIVEHHFDVVAGGEIRVANPAGSVLLLQSSDTFQSWETVATDHSLESYVDFAFPIQSQARRKFYRVVTGPLEP